MKTPTQTTAVEVERVSRASSLSFCSSGSSLVVCGSSVSLANIICVVMMTLFLHPIAVILFLTSSPLSLWWSSMSSVSYPCAVSAVVSSVWLLLLVLARVQSE